MNPRYTLLVDAWPANGEAAVRLWSAHSELGPRAELKLQTAYLDNPAGAGACLLLIDTASGQAIGALGLHRRRWWLGERSCDTVLLSDFAVDGAHRTLGPALMLMRAGIAWARERQMQVLGMPNPASLAVARRAGLQPVIAMPRRGKLLRSAYLLRRRGWTRAPATITRPLDESLAVVDRWLSGHQGWRWHDIGFDDARLQAVWDDRPRDLWLSDRSPRTLAWRYAGIQRPCAWRISLVDDGSGRPEGYVVWREAQDLVEVADFLCRDLQRNLGALLLGFAGHCRRMGHVSALSVEFAGPPASQQALTHIGFLVKDAGQPVMGLSVAADEGPRDPLMFLTSHDRDPDV